MGREILALRQVEMLFLCVVQLRITGFGELVFRNALPVIQRRNRGIPNVTESVDLMLLLQQSFLRHQHGSAMLLVGVVRPRMLDCSEFVSGGDSQESTGRKSEASSQTLLGA